MSTRHTVPSAMLAALSLATLTPAAEPRAPVDAELLEFLGSLDTEDEEWRDFLAERPVEAGDSGDGKRAGAKSPNARKPVETAPPRKEKDEREEQQQ